MPVARDQLLLYRGIAQGPLVHTLSEEPGHTPTPNDVEGSPIARSHRIGINRSMGRTRPPPNCRTGDPGKKRASAIRRPTW
jgi:hypothetical protein